MQRPERPERVRRTASADGAAAGGDAGAPPSGFASSERLLALLEGVEASHAPTRSEVLAISSEVCAVSEAQLLALPYPRLRTLLQSLHLVIAAAPTGKEAGGRARQRAAGEEQDDEMAEAGEGEEAEDDDDADVATRVLHALDASLLVLRLVGIPQMPADLLIEESLEHMLSLAKRCLAKLHATMRADPALAEYFASDMYTKWPINNPMVAVFVGPLGDEHDF